MLPDYKYGRAGLGSILLKRVCASFISILLLNYHSTKLSFGKAQTSLFLLSLNRFVRNSMNSRCPS